VDVQAAVDGFTEAFRAAGTAERAEQQKRYLKSDLEFLGVTVPAIRRELKGFLRASPELGRTALLGLVEALWDHPVHELRMAAVVLLEVRGGLLEPEDMGLVERLIRESKTWAYVDGLAAHTAGGLAEAHPELVNVLDRWATDGNFWVRRSAMLALMLSLRRSEGDPDRLLRYADSMLEEKEFFIRKAIGWVLREMSKSRPEVVREYLASRGDRVSGLTLREGAKRLPEADREALLEAYKAH